MSLLVANNGPATTARPEGQLPNIEASAVQDGFSDYLFAERRMGGGADCNEEPRRSRRPSQPTSLSLSIDTQAETVSAWSATQENSPTRYAAYEVANAPRPGSVYTTETLPPYTGGPPSYHSNTSYVRHPGALEDGEQLPNTQGTRERRYGSTRRKIKKIWETMRQVGGRAAAVVGTGVTFIVLTVTAHYSERPSTSICY
ncbi:hypothetical protein QBC46DRAFT_407758 [Diplogelasinospora grovesii]|uniref:Uncharacterized protein n=1 Tax=Diplogelasinospora grovesii TaxID=303347 RepID=A0AAN6NA45_9PEZI|nr:hypothetical protein QBC46DRAFT_407758 [Diplogelasinospora grovesii]